MKFKNQTIKFAAAAIFAVIVSTCLVFAKQPVKLKQLNLEITHGEVRVILLRAGQVVSTNGQKQFVATYAVEIPDKGAFSDLHLSSDTALNLAVRGQAIAFSFSKGNTCMGFEDLQKETGLQMPETTKGKAICADELLIGNLDGDFKIDSKKVDVIVQFDWRKNPQKFVFKDVPLN